MTISLAVSFISLLIASLSAIYTRRNASETKQANEITRFNTLLALKKDVLEQLRFQESLVPTLNHSPSGMQAIHQRYSELDTKLRQINSEIESFPINKYT